MNWVEPVATLSGLLCVYFSIKQNLLTWVFGFIQVALYTWIFYQEALYSDMGLHVFYMGIQVVGYRTWKQGGNAEFEFNPSSIGWWLYVWIFVAIAGSVLLGLGMSSYTNASMAYPDAFTTTASIIAQIMMIKKIVESWIFWIVVNMYAIVVYAVKDLYFSTGLYAVFFIMAVWGLIQWNEIARKNMNYAS